MSRAAIHREFYRHGQLRLELSVRRGVRHGLMRTWHMNGVLASEEPYDEDLAHGIFRQWNEGGRLLGEYRMERGTGLPRLPGRVGKPFPQGPELEGRTQRAFVAGLLAREGLVEARTWLAGGEESGSRDGV